MKKRLLKAKTGLFAAACALLLAWAAAYVMGSDLAEGLMLGAYIPAGLLGLLVFIYRTVLQYTPKKLKWHEWLTIGFGVFLSAIFIVFGGVYAAGGSIPVQANNVAFIMLLAWWRIGDANTESDSRGGRESVKKRLLEAKTGLFAAACALLLAWAAAYVMGSDLAKGLMLGAYIPAGLLLTLLFLYAAVQQR